MGDYATFIDTRIFAKYIVDSFREHPVPDDRDDKPAIDHLDEAVRFYESHGDSLRATMIGIVRYIVATANEPEGVKLLEDLFETPTGNSLAHFYAKETAKMVGEPGPGPRPGEN